MCPCTLWIGLEGIGLEFLMSVFAISRGVLEDEREKSLLGANPISSFVFSLMLMFWTTKSFFGNLYDKLEAYRHQSLIPPNVMEIRGVITLTPDPPLLLSLLLLVSSV